ncbi:YodC family protein [Shewanella sp. D64]|uniref:DUF2158 domain-containing protein n=1 Tax=unclassified Shewanella TaxID=196818 RepID=UPI0022BA53CD|nr:MULTISPECIES: DUF2158 domain-containing protein [unclassified Shewanella]MEC4725944.1 YodC family protein [Shewanella sp. D64]MEC4737199.1 YodC family protein [Shewanella sp. E94]WBJ93578.1 YodC family protein [Shewanella sp. MTB7]
MMTKERKPKYELGNVVTLVSGGPDMAIKEIIQLAGFKGNYKAQWFAGKKLEMGLFPEESLKLAAQKAD